MKPIPGLQDIQGLDHIGVWPFALGWWLLLGFFAAAAIVAMVSYFWRLRKLRRWQHGIFDKLDHLEKNLNFENSQSSAIQLSEILRRLAIHNYSRAECASLEGNAWLEWLTEKDSSKFNWVKSSRSLIEAPFKPQGTVIDPRSLRQSIRAAKGWVK